MADSSEGLGAASFVTQANALLRKNATFQKRNMKTNCCIISFPVIFCLLIGVANIIIHNIISRQPEAQCDGNSMNPKCPIASPPKWLPLLQVPRPESRACRADYIPFTDLPDESCRRTQKCPATILLTGGNRSFAESVGQNLFPSLLSLNISEYGITLPASIMGTDSETGDNQFDEPAFYSLSPLYVLQSKCTRSLAVPLQIVSKKLDKEIACIEGLPLWRDNSSLVNDELFKGYPEGNKEKKSNEITAAYDFLTSNENRYMINIWYNSTNGGTDNKIMRVPRSVNAVGISVSGLPFNLKAFGFQFSMESAKHWELPGEELRTRTMRSENHLNGGVYCISPYVSHSNWGSKCTKFDDLVKGNTKLEHDIRDVATYVGEALDACVRTKYKYKGRVRKVS
ncbi:uncharacterized protein A4U43_C03F18190 [Asparagus officinalis]|uniref:Uncharacterized protein n=1 Tax=Asparagus officinalis TaxID=4686 RepID=A0A5P1FBM2_ASPOF|nr:uncharacterized protein A4U43_C03F18190 [Asparagus officinalis]